MHRMIPAVPEPLAIAVAAVAAAIMGLAIQRGGTCMVAAVNEAANARRCTKAAALGEAAIWVLAILAVGKLAGLPMAFSPSFAVDIWVVVGGMLLGFGALFNGACVIGSIARLGSGNWHYLLTPVGYFLGSFLHEKSPIIRHAEQEPPASAFTGWLVTGVLVLFVIYRARRIARIGIREHTSWTEHRATAVIGVAFGVLFLFAGPWTYTDVLSRMAHRMMGFGVLEPLLFLMLLAGAVAGGWQSRIPEPWCMRLAAGCLVGGTLMGFGGSMVPGGNDNLVLVGLPMFHAYAWLAVASMVAAIWMGLIVKPRLRGPGQSPSMAHLS